MSAATTRQAPECAQCGTRDSHGGVHEEHGYLCLRCAYRQTMRDDRRDGIED